jgi:putative addiction module killer protein
MSVAYGLQMIEVRETGIFSGWLSGLRDARAKAEVARRVRRLALGNPGDVKPVGDGLASFEFSTALDTGSITRNAGSS